MTTWSKPVTVYVPPNSWGSAGQQHIFFRGEGDDFQGYTIEHVYYDAASQSRPHAQWLGPQATYVRATGTPPMAASDPATMYTDNTGQLHIFYIGIGSGIEHIFYDPGLMGLVYEHWWVGAQGVLGTMYTPFPGDQQHVFFTTMGGDVWQIFYDSSANGLLKEMWVSAQSVGGPTPGVWGPTGKPAPLYLGDGVGAGQALFCRTTASGLNVTTWSPNTPVASDVWVPGNVSASGGRDPNALLHGPASLLVGDPAPLDHWGGGDVVDVFYRGVDSGGNSVIYHLWVNHDDTIYLSGWGGPVMNSEIWAYGSFDPVPLYYPDTDQKHTFFLGKDSGEYTIEHVFSDPVGGIMPPERWVGPNAIPAVNTDGVQGQPPAATSRDPATMYSADDSIQHVFYRGLDGGIYQVFWSPTDGQLWEQWVY